MALDGGDIAGVGFCTRQRRDLSNLDEELARISGTGASHAELALFGMDLIAGGRVLPKQVDRLARICARHPLRYTAHGPLAVNFMDPANLDAYETGVHAYLEVCGAVGAEIMVHHPGVAAAAPPEQIEALHALERDALVRAGDAAAKHGVRLAVETLCNFNSNRYVATPERLAQLIREVDHGHVTGTLDFSHCYLHCGFLGLDFFEQARAFAPVTGHLHVHDSFGRPTPGRPVPPSEAAAFGFGDLHLPIGWGDLPYAELLPSIDVQPGTVWIFELPPHFSAHANESMEQAKRLIAMMG